jgi:hypothetical protein
LDSAHLFRFLSRPRNIAEVAKRFGLTLDQVEQLLREALISGRLVVSADSGKGSMGMPVHPSQALSFLPRSGDSGRTTGMPRIRSRIHDKNDSWSKYRNLRFKFQEALPSTVKQVGPSHSFGEVFKAKGSGRYESPALMSLPLETRLLGSLTTGPKTMMDLRAAFAVSRLNVENLERSGLVESFWGSKGVGRTFGITRKGLMELKRLKMASSIDRKMREKPMMSVRKITAQFPV